MSVCSIAAAVNVEICGRCDSGAQEEDRIKYIECNDDNRNRKSLAECGRKEVEERQHAKDGYEHVVVDNARVSSKGGSDHVANESHYYERT